MTSDTNLSNATPSRTILVTGGSSGLGLATCHALADAGNTAIGIVDINAEATEAALAELRAKGVPCAAAVGDITTRESAEALTAEIVQALGGLTGLVNCAGVYPRRPILDITDADWDFSFSVNVRGLYNMTIAAVARMEGNSPVRDIRGRVLNVSSIDAFKPHPKNAHYAAMKAAVVSLTRSLGLELAPKGILVNGIAPAGIATAKAHAAGFVPELTAQSAIGRAAEPEDIADVIAFLMSDGNRYMVGETVVTAGGYYIP
ncbi:MAG: SDR family oxidoreductase [Acetobacter sp.]